MNFDYSGFPGTGGCWYASDFVNCSSNQVYMGLCLDYDPQQWFTFVNLGTAYSGNEDHPEVLIQLYDEGSPRCLTRIDSQIFVEPYCNPEDVRQRFFALQGSFTGIKFELGQYQGYTHDNCVTNAHHPKSGSWVGGTFSVVLLVVFLILVLMTFRVITGEVVEFHICEFARDPHDATSFWELF
jgi:hypothetical protein